MNAFYNWTGRTITQKVRFGGTSYPNQTHYGVDGNELNTEIVPHKTRPNHWQIYWIPDEPLAPEEHLYYGWSMNNKRKLPKLPGDVYSLTMQNQFGSPAIETFFLVLPKELKISQSNPPTRSQELLNFNVHWWTKTVHQNENHVERIQLVKVDILANGTVITTVNDFLKALIADDTTEAIKLVTASSAVGHQLDDISEIPNYETIQIASVHADNKKAFAVTDVIFTDNGQDTVMTITLVKQRVIWMVDDIDMETSEKAKADIQEFLKKHPAARRLEKAKVSKADKLASENLTSQGWKLWGQRKLTEAEEKFKEAIAKDPEAENAYQGLGWAQLNQGKKLNAKDSFEKCIKLNLKNSAALKGLGWIAHGQGNIYEAISWWEKAVTAQPGATASLSGLTQVYMERNEYDKAEKYYQMWIKAEPNNKDAIEGLEKSRTLQGKPPVSEAEIKNFIKQLGEKEEKPFAALNKLIEIGEPAVEQLIAKMMRRHNSNWQFPKALGGIGDKRAVGPLIAKWKDTDTSPMNDVIAEALNNITGKDFGKDLEKWQQWWNINKELYTPADTIQNFMAAAIKLNADKAMTFVAPDSHDYEDIKETFENSENPFNIMFRKLDASKSVKIIETKIKDTMCSAVWRVSFKEEFTIEGKTFKVGETFDLDGNLHKYGDKWLITGI